MKLFLMEGKKLKGSKILLPIVLLPLLSVVFGSLNYAANREILKREWLSLWTQVYLFYSLFFLPALIGVICSYIWAGEHKNQNFNLLLTSAHPLWKHVVAKNLLALFLVFLVQSILFVLYMGLGSIFSFHSSFPSSIFYYLLLTIIFSLSLIGMQSYLSLKIKSFATPVAVALIFSFFGFLVTAKGTDLLNLSFLPCLFPMSSMTMAMNHLPQEIYGVKSFLWMLLVTLISIGGFSYLQVVNLRSRRR